MKKSILLILIFACFQLGAQDGIYGAYGAGDVRVRAPQGSIFEAQIRNYRIDNTEFSKIALIYWPDQEIGLQKIGITIFENKTHIQKVTSQFTTFADSLVKNKFESLTQIDFDFIDAEPNALEKIFAIKQFGPKLKIEEGGKKYLELLNNQGYDGLFILYEHDLQDLFTGTNIWLPSKGIFKYLKKNLIYHGLYCLLINTNTKKQVKKVGYQQISGDYYTGNELADPIDLNNVLNDLEIRFENNINEIIEVHKLQ
ncbi:MAG: hypothetical protein V2I47_08400 [Bacteroidales bacterium]|jgi:hypothetical protein|nr:hypothetical protein [Bacteroidales bacterium]